MKVTINLYSFLLLMMLFCILASGTSCNTSRPVTEVAGNYDRIPVYANSLLDISVGDPRLMNLQRTSHAFVSSRDSFVITLFDMTENESFDNSKDVVVVTSLKDSMAPIIPLANCNTAFYSPGLPFDFNGTQYQLINASSDGNQVFINRVKSSRDSKPQMFVTDAVSNELMISEINSSNSFNLLKTIQDQHKKYVLLDFWSPYCPPCFENIPTLKKIESSGIAIINIFQMNDDEVGLVENQISRFDIPGINFRSSPELIKYFSQNGLPYTVLVEAYDNKILLSTHRIAEQEIYINQQ